MALDLGISVSRYGRDPAGDANAVVAKLRADGTVDAAHREVMEALRGDARLRAQVEALLRKRGALPPLPPGGGGGGGADGAAGAGGAGAAAAATGSAAAAAAAAAGAGPGPSSSLAGLLGRGGGGGGGAGRRETFDSLSQQLRDELTSLAHAHVWRLLSDPDDPRGLAADNAARVKEALIGRLEEEEAATQRRFVELHAQHLAQLQQRQRHSQTN